MYALYCKQRERRVKETYSAVNLRTGLNRSDTRSRREGRNSESNWESAPASSLFNRRKLWSFDGTSEANLAALSKLAILSREIGDIIPTIVKKRNPRFRWTSVVVRKHSCEKQWIWREKIRWFCTAGIFQPPKVCSPLLCDGVCPKQHRN